MNKSLPLREQLRALEQLQELDLKILNITKKKAALPETLKEIDTQLAALKKNLDTKSGDKDTFEKGIRQTQAALELNQDRMVRASKKLENVGNQQEFQAASKEQEQLKKSNDELEKQKTEFQTRIDQLEKEMSALRDECAKVQAERDARAKTVAGEESQLDGSFDELMRERDGKKTAVDPQILARYDRVRKARAGLGIVPAGGGRCTGCNMHLPPQLFNMIQRGDELQNCPSCHRILFLPSEKGNG